MHEAKEAQLKCAPPAQYQFRTKKTTSPYAQFVLDSGTSRHRSSKNLSFVVAQQHDLIDY